MSEVIYKYHLRTRGKGRASVMLPAVARILDIQLQNLDLVLWAIVNPEHEPTILHEFAVVPTGAVLPDFLKDRSPNTGLNLWTYIKTVQIGPLVAHLWKKN